MPCPKYEAERAKEAEAKMLSGKKDPSSNLNEGTNPIRTAAEVAKKIGVSEKSAITRYTAFLGA